MARKLYIAKEDMILKVLEKEKTFVRNNYYPWDIFVKVYFDKFITEEMGDALPVTEIIINCGDTEFDRTDLEFSLNNIVNF